MLLWIPRLHPLLDILSLTPMSYLPGRYPCFMSHLDPSVGLLGPVKSHLQLDYHLPEHT